VAAAPRLERDALTRLAYIALGLWGFLLYALGPALPELRREFDVSRTVVSFHTTLVALGAVAVGLFGARVVARLGRRRAFWTAIAGAAAGAALLALGPALTVTLPGAALMGFSGGLLVALIQAILADRHGRLSAAALSEANALATLMGAVAPFSIALAILAGSDWRAPVLAVALVGLPLLGIVHRSVHFPPGAVPAARGAARLPRTYWRLWTGLVLFVSAEFCIALWSVDYLETEVGLRRSAATGFASLFLLGMAAGRAAGGRLARRTSSRRLLAGSLALAGAGFGAFWLSPWPAAAVAGLAVTGLGIALLYPLTVALAIDAVPGRSVTASARIALGSGVAIALAPFILAALADTAGLFRAYAIVPALLAGGWLAGRR
jgi:MFS family permease